MSLSNVFCHKVSNAKSRILSESHFLFSHVFPFHSNRVSLPRYRRYGGLQGCPLTRSGAGCVQHIPHSPTATANPSLRSVSTESLTGIFKTTMNLLENYESVRQ